MTEFSQAEMHKGLRSFGLQKVRRNKLFWLCCLNTCTVHILSFKSLLPTPLAAGLGILLRGKELPSWDFHCC